MRATIIVRKRQPDSIVSLVCVDTLDEKTVHDTVAELEQRYPKSHYRIDTMPGGAGAAIARGCITESRPAAAGGHHVLVRTDCGSCANSSGGETGNECRGRL